MSVSSMNKAEEWNVLTDERNTVEGSHYDIRLMEIRGNKKVNK